MNSVCTIDDTQTHADISNALWSGVSDMNEVLRRSTAHWYFVLLVNALSARRTESSCSFFLFHLVKRLMERHTCWKAGKGSSTARVGYTEEGENCLRKANRDSLPVL